MTETSGRYFVGTAIFENDVIILGDTPVIPSKAKRAMNGELVIITNGYDKSLGVGFELKFQFFWETWDTVQRLRSIMGKQSCVGFKVDTWSGTCIINPDKGLTNIEHPSGGKMVTVEAVVGTALDIWNGEVSLLIQRGWGNW